MVLAREFRLPGLLMITMLPSLPDIKTAQTLPPPLTIAVRVLWSQWFRVLGAGVWGFGCLSSVLSYVTTRRKKEQRKTQEEKTEGEKEEKETRRRRRGTYQQSRLLPIEARGFIV